eukprot:7982410-Lingulodinium_polyedra.AAC.1
MCIRDRCYRAGASDGARLRAVARVVLENNSGHGDSLLAYEARCGRRGAQVCGTKHARRARSVARHP